ncbi:hypothetical protein ACEQPO_28805 [Bacillus sp. SL00103]
MVHSFFDKCQFSKGHPATNYVIRRFARKAAKAKALNKQIDQRKKQVKQPQKKVKTLVVYGAPGTYMAALPQSLSGDLLHIAGGTNIAE